MCYLLQLAFAIADSHVLCRSQAGSRLALVFIAVFQRLLSVFGSVLTTKIAIISVRTRDW